MTLLLTAAGRWAGPLLIMALILAGRRRHQPGPCAGHVESPRRPARASAQRCLGMSLGWPVLVFFLFANAPRDDWFPYWVMMGSPVASMAPSRAASRRTRSMPGPAWRSPRSAGPPRTPRPRATLFGLTLLTFDGCLGRIPDVPGRPKRRRTWP